MFNFLIFFTLFIIFIVPLISLIFLRDGGKSILSPFIIGILIYLIGIQALKNIMFKLIGYLPGDTSIIWGNKWFYGIFMSVTTGFFVEFTRFVFLSYRNKKKRWSSSVRRNAIVGIGEGWITAIFAWGAYIATAAFNLVYYKDVSRFGLETNYMMLMLLEQVISLFLYIALTFIAQFGVRRNKGKNYLFVCIAVHSFACMLLYFIPYKFDLPLLVGEIAYAIVACLAFAYGYVLIKSLHAHRVRTNQSHAK